MTAALLGATGLTKRFNGVPAVTEVALSLAAGEARGLIGENGAGKSTLIGMLTGALVPDAGQLMMDGTPVRFTRPLDALDAGIATVHQHSSLIPNLTVWQNIELGTERGGNPLRPVPRRPRSATRDVLALAGVADLANQTVERLSLAQRQLVAIARAYSRGGRLLILDEPTASLSPSESHYLFALIERLRLAGVALLYVTHRLDELSAVVDSVTVLRAGRVVEQVPATMPEPELVGLMVGREGVARERRIAENRQHATVDPGAEPVVVGEGLTDAAGRFVNVDLAVRPGEVVALVGLPDSGVAQLTQAIAGARRLAGGQLRVAGAVCRFRAPADAVSAGVAYLVGDRKERGLASNATVTQTISAASLRRVSRFGVLHRGRERRLVEQLIESCRVIANDPETPITALSGGNQQKALFARTLATEPRVIVCEDPTAGVDPGGRDSLYELIAQFVAGRNAVVLNTSDLREVTIVANRAIVLRRGHVVGELRGDELTEGNLMHAQFGATAPGAARVEG